MEPMEEDQSKDLLRRLNAALREPGMETMLKQLLKSLTELYLNSGRAKRAQRLCALVICWERESVSKKTAAFVRLMCKANFSEVEFHCITRSSSMCQER